MNTKALTRHQLMAALMPALLIAAPAALVPNTGWSQQIEEVTVTARRREENVQDIPVSVASFDSEFIQKQGVVSNEDIVKLVPGVQFDQGFSSADTRISIRGINNSRGRSSVAMLVDGIDISGENVTAGGGGSLLNSRMLDLERIEVVKGPQSALYGRNAFGGAINYITRKPSMDGLYSSVSADVGNYETINVKAAVSGPVTDSLALGITASSYNNEGYYTNPNDGSELNGIETKGIRLAALWAPADSFELDFSASFSEEDTDPRAVVKVGTANQLYLDGQPLPAGTPATFTDLLTATGTVPSGQDFGHWLGTVNKVSESDINLSSMMGGGAFKGSEDERQFYALNITWDINSSITFKSITSYLNNEADLNEDADFQDGFGTPLSYLEPVGIPTFYHSLVNDYTDQTETKQFTQDFILQSSSWERGTWLVGGQFFREEVDNYDKSLGYYNDGQSQAGAYAMFGLSDFFQCGTDTPIFNPAPPPGFPSLVFDYSCSVDQTLAGANPPKNITRDTDSYSIYGLVSFDFTEKFSGTFEGRYIKDEIDVATNTAYDRLSQYLAHVPPDYFLPPGTLPISDTNKTDSFNPRIALDYRFTDDVMVYGSAAKGTKPGGFGTSQMSVPTAARMDPETLYAYELGTKTTWRDGTLRFNAALFFNDYQDRQVGVTVTDPVLGFPAAGIVNAAEAETKGFEMDVLWLPTENLTLGVGYAYTDAEWTDFNYTDIRADSPRPGPTVKDKAICGNAEGDCSGAAMAGIPENAWSLVGNYTAPIGGAGLEWFANVVGQYQDKRAVSDQINTPYISSSWRWDTQIGLQNESWAVMLFVQNLLDDETVLWGQPYQDFKDGMHGATGALPRDESVMAFLPDPRVAGVRASWKFGN